MYKMVSYKLFNIVCNILPKIVCYMVSNMWSHILSNIVLRYRASHGV